MDRTEAGRRLANTLAARGWAEPPVVLAISPGGATVGFEIARALHAELDLFEVRPFAARGREVGEVASGGVRVVHADVRDALKLSDEEVDDAAAPVAEQIHRREHGWRRRHPRASLAGRAVVLVTDVIGPDARADAAVMVARATGARQVVFAAAVGLPATLAQLREDADDVVCLEEADDLRLAGDPPGDEALRALLERAEEWRAPMTV
ncbi:MAG: phosphoribosyltransferase [Myxococcota bacterium]